MGQEYRIAWKPADEEAMKAWLQSRGGASIVCEGKEQFEFRFRTALGTGLPDATVMLEQDGIYFCDYTRADEVAAIFRGLIDKALTHSDASDSVVVRGL